MVQIEYELSLYIEGVKPESILKGAEWELFET